MAPLGGCDPTLNARDHWWRENLPFGPSMISMRGNPYGADVYENPDNNLFANLSAAEQGIDAMPSQ